MTRASMPSSPMTVRTVLRAAGRHRWVLAWLSAAAVAEVIMRAVGL